ncbi:MAG: hypothetical protein WCW35_02575 [Bacteroidota bacterium]
MNRFLLAFSLLLLFGSCEDQEIVGIPPSDYELKQNRPNPFVDTTLIEYGIPSVGTSPPRIRIMVYDRFHDRVVLLRDSSSHPAGIFTIGWRPFNTLPAGLYYIELQKVTGILQENIVLKRIATLKN